MQTIRWEFFVFASDEQSFLRQAETLEQLLDSRLVSYEVYWKDERMFFSAFEGELMVQDFRVAVFDTIVLAGRLASRWTIKSPVKYRKIREFEGHVGEVDYQSKVKVAMGNFRLSERCGT